MKLNMIRNTFGHEGGLKPSFNKPSVPDERLLRFLTGVETPAYDKPSVPDEASAESISFGTQIFGTQ